MIMQKQAYAAYDDLDGFWYANLDSMFLFFSAVTLWKSFFVLSEYLHE